jgi:hypothetical protein
MCGSIIKVEKVEEKIRADENELFQLTLHPVKHSPE